MGEAKTFEVEVTERICTVGNRTYARGVYPNLPGNVAQELIETGKGRLVGKGAAPDDGFVDQSTIANEHNATGAVAAPWNKEEGKTGATKKAKEPEAASDELPKSFPSRAALVKAGLDTVTAVRDAGPKGLADAGLSEAQVAKVGLALDPNAK